MFHLHRRWAFIPSSRTAILCTSVVAAAAAPARGDCAPEQAARLVAPVVQERAEFGGSNDVSGNSAIIGANREDHSGLDQAGAAYVFVRAGGVWTQQARLIASDPAATDLFGHAVAISGDAALVSAPYDDHAGGLDSGSVYAFTRAGDVWSEQAFLSASDAATTDRFGVSVALDGDIAVVGAYGDDNAGGAGAGCAYVFERAGNVWTERAKLTASDANEGDGLGYAVAVRDETIVVGSRWADGAGGLNCGAAYVYVRSGSVWTEQAKLVADDGEWEDGFSYAVSISGDTVLCGANHDDLGTRTNAGSAYVFTRSGSVWTQQAKLVAPGPDLHLKRHFGWSAAISGHTVAVGAPADRIGTMTSVGSGYVFVRSGNVWSYRGRLLAAEPDPGDALGWWTSLDGDNIVIGALDFGGSAYIFDARVINCRGDTNCDSRVNFFDIDPFLLALFDPPAYAAAWPACDILNGDLNDDQIVDFADIDAFVACLFGVCP